MVVAAVPWARAGSRFTTALEDTAAWLVCHAALSVVAILLRVAWRSVWALLKNRLPFFVTLATTITRYRTLILNAVEHSLSNARTEATNTHLRLLTRRAYGYHSPDSLIAMADLTRGGPCPPDDHENLPTETSAEHAILSRLTLRRDRRQSPRHAARL